MAPTPSQSVAACVRTTLVFDGLAPPIVAVCVALVAGGFPVSGPGQGPVALPIVAGKAPDVDRDGLGDALEDVLAERFAPIIFHGERETSFPVDVDWWLQHTHLSVLDTTSGGERTRRVMTGPLHQHQLLDHVVRVGQIEVSSGGTRSRGKRVSFYLDTVPESARPKALRPADWVTYVHSYPNDLGGVSLQYWRAYTWNDAGALGLDVGHGGDWEAVMLHLDTAQKVRQTVYLDHSGMVDWGDTVRWEGTHPLVWSQEGGHSSHPDSRRMRSRRWIRHQTWTGGVVTRWDDTPLGVSGGLRNIGEKTRPRNDQAFVQYSGLWGTPGRLFMTSGYWGPAFNETDARCSDGAAAYKSFFSRPADSPRCTRILLKAWCDRMGHDVLERDVECYAANETF
jgi:hypothetical protein